MSLHGIRDFVERSFGGEVAAALSWVYYHVVGPVVSERQIGPVALGMAITVAFVFYAIKLRENGVPLIKGFLGYLVPRRLFLHRSALLDYRFFVFNQILLAHVKIASLAVWAVGLLSVGEAVKWTLTAFLGPGDSASEASFSVQLAFTALSLMAFDFGKYIAHYLLHKVKFLWEFHKVHHSSEVLTPISAFRMHPVDSVIDLFFRLLMTGIVAGVFEYRYPAGVPELTILAFNAVGMFFYYPILSLQHSHVALHYGPGLSKILLSPYMHQIHHSQEVRHWDKNIGFAFAFWDRMFGTLYIPRPDENFRLGLPPNSGSFDSIWALYVGPFVRLFLRLRGSSPGGVLPESSGSSKLE